MPRSSKRVTPEDGYEYIADEMPYSCTVVRRGRCRVELDIEPEQPDAEPFYSREDFALGLLIDGNSSQLSDQLGDGAIEDIAVGNVDAKRFVRSLSLSIERKGSMCADTSPIVRYAIEVTEPRWIAHLEEGSSYESYAWSEAEGPVLAESDIFEPRVRIAIGPFAKSDRVSVHADLPIAPGTLHGRGIIEASTRCERVPSWWDGGQLAYRVAFDHGPVAWALAESLRRPPIDTYERAWAEPETFWTALLATAPLERARGLHFLGLRGGGALQLAPEGARSYTVAIESGCAWTLGLLRRLPMDRAVAISTALLEGWLTDPTARSQTQRFGRLTSGHELAARDTIEAYQFECYAPTAFVLGALTLLFAESRVRAAASIELSLRRILAALPAQLFGYPGWNDLAAYPLAACSERPTALPTWLLRGHDRDATELGLEGSWVPPIERDLYCP